MCYPAPLWSALEDVLKPQHIFAQNTEESVYIRFLNLDSATVPFFSLMLAFLPNFVSGWFLAFARQVKECLRLPGRKRRLPMGLRDGTEALRAAALRWAKSSHRFKIPPWQQHHHYGGTTTNRGAGNHPSPAPTRPHLGQPISPPYAKSCGTAALAEESEAPLRGWCHLPANISKAVPICSKIAIQNTYF